MEINLHKSILLKIKRISNTRQKPDNDFWSILLMSLALFLMLNFGPQFIDFVKASTSSVSFTATVGSTLTFTMDASSKSFGTITSGTPVQATSTLYIVTNNGTGFNTQLKRASSTATLFTGDFTNSANTILDSPNSNNWTAPSATTTAGPSAVWNIGSTQGLGFRVMTGAAGGASTTCGTATSWWGSDDGGANSKWSGISTSTASSANSQIANCGYYNAATQGQTVIYRLDVSTNQAGGSYLSSPVTFTAVANP